MIQPYINRLQKLGRELGHTVRSTSFQFSLFFTIAFSICTMIGMVFIYNTAEREISKQIDSRISAESGRLRGFFLRRLSIGIATTTLGITERAPSDPGMSFCFMRKSAPQLFPQIKQKPYIMLNTSFQDLCNPLFNADSDKPDGKMRVMISSLGENYMLVVGYDRSGEDRLLKAMSNVVFGVTILLLLTSFIGSYFLSRDVMRRISRISSTARRIVDGDFSERITIEQSSDELTQLSRDLNHMLDRIESLITSQRQVTNNIAHDLRSPLNRLRSRMEVALLDRKANSDSLRTVMEKSINDAENLLKTFNALLSIAQVESRARDDFECLDLSDICEDLAELYEVVSEDGGHQFSSRIQPGLHLKGNRQLLAQAITNLLDNAIKYTESRGCIRLHTYIRDNNACVSVSDDGSGIPEEKRQEVLKRFVRLDSARSTPGNGLGLSLVSAVVALHRGHISLEDNRPGLIVTLCFPLVKEQETTEEENPDKENS